MTIDLPGTATDEADIDCCTIISKSYAGQALTMIRSYRKHHPLGRFFVLTIDGVPASIDFTREQAELVAIDDLMIPDLAARRMQYAAVEFCVSLRPALLSYLMQRRGARNIVHLDADLFFTGEMRGLSALFEKHDFVLTPHFFSPLPEDGKRPSDRDILAVGTCNAGFFGCRNSPETDRILGWLSDRLRKYSYHRPEQFMFGDQRWLDLLLSISTGVHLLKDDVYNVSSWNLHERRLTRENGRYLVNGSPMAFYHFSGFRPGHPPTLSVYQNRFTLEPGSPLSCLVDEYQRALTDADDERHRQNGYAFDHFENGVRISPVIRRIFEEVGGAVRFLHPFSVDRGSFFEWLLRPSEISGLRNVHTALHDVVPDAKSAFPVLREDDVKRFASWLLRNESQQLYKLDPQFRAPLASLALLPTMRQGSGTSTHGILEKRHGCLPYQMLCKGLKRVIGNERYNRLKPRRIVEEGTALSDAPPLFRG